MKLPIKPILDGKIPTYAHSGDAGMDLYSAEECVLRSGERRAVKTGISMAIPDGYVGLVWDKSGLAINKGIKTLGGVVDAGYRGEVMVGLINLSPEPHAIRKGDKIAQMLIQKVEHVEIELVKDLDDTSRGTGGFGSTGKN